MFSASIFAGSGGATAARIKAGLARAKSLEIDVGPLPPHGCSTPDTGYLAGDDSQRRASLEAALNSSAQIAWALRGGYGLTRLFPFEGLDFAAATVLGFSDVTALLAVVHAAGGTAIHGPVLTSLADADATSVAALGSAWRGEARRWALAGEPVDIAAPIIGGNLEVLTRLIGTPYQPRYADQIVVVEEVGEPWYRCDRSLTHLLQTTDLGSAAAIVFGDFHACEAHVASRLVARLSALGAVCLQGAPVGHGPTNQAFVWGERAQINGTSLVLQGQRP